MGFHASEHSIVEWAEPAACYTPVVPLLYYWRPDHHRNDLDWGAGHHLNQDTKRLHVQAYLTWMFERRGTRKRAFGLTAAQLTPAAYKQMLEQERGRAAA